MAQAKEDVYCTLVMTDSYLPGAAVLAHSLRDNGTTKKLAALITQDSLKPETILQLKSLYDHVIPVPRISNGSLSNLASLGRLDLRDANTKITLWNQTQFRKIVYIDADIVALRAPDELFDLPAPFAAAPDIGWPDCFNSGVMLLSPSEAEYNALSSLAAGGNSFDGADQGLLNEYYENKPWHRLSFTYNCTPSASYQYEPAYRHFKNQIKMVHFIGREKPWTKGRQALHSERSGVYKELLSRWWAVFDRHFTAKQQFPSQQHDLAVRLIKQYVTGEQSSGFEWASTGQAAAETSAEKHVRFAEETKSEPAPEPARPASPPQQRWDATREAPPTKSEAEAHDFPSIHYSMSHSQDLFHAPKEYPEPPKNMWYEVPETKPKPRVKPKPIFPWESHAIKPTRVFADDEPEYEPEVAEGFMLKTSLSPTSPVSPTPVTPTIKVTHSDPWTSFSSKNAWDDDASIDRYVQSLKQSQFRGSVQVLHDMSNPSSPRVTSPPSVSTSTRTTPAPDRKAYKISDMTSSMDLPSMPVTPAVSYRKQVFWGSDAPSSSSGGNGGKGKEDILPAAQGVPEQSEWVCQNCGTATPLRDVLRQLSERTAAVARGGGGAGSPKPLPPRMKSLATPTVTPGVPDATSFASSSSLSSRASTVPPDASPAPASSIPRRPPHISQPSPQPPTQPPTAPQRPSTSSPTPAHRRANPHPATKSNSNSANALFFTKNPLERLEELRRTSISDLPAPGSAAELPTREMPKSAAPLPTEGGGNGAVGGESGSVSWQPPAPVGGDAASAGSGGSSARGAGERRAVSGPAQGSQRSQRVPSEYDLA